MKKTIFERPVDVMMAANGSRIMRHQQDDRKVDARNEELRSTMNAIPTAGAGGQVINIAVNNGNAPLPLKEWMARGVIGALGHAAAWPFKTAGRAVEGIVSAIVTLIKWALILFLLPTLIIAGIRFQQKTSADASVEATARSITHDVRHTANGIGRGINDDLPAETSRK